MVRLDAPDVFFNLSHAQLNLVEKPLDLLQRDTRSLIWLSMDLKDIIKLLFQVFVLPHKFNDLITPCLDARWNLSLSKLLSNRINFALTLLDFFDLCLLFFEGLLDLSKLVP